MGVLKVLEKNGLRPDIVVGNSMGAIIGASWTGARTMTATSGPGFSLMQENIGYAIMTETPCVVVDVQRSGPATGQASRFAIITH